MHLRPRARYLESMPAPFLCLVGMTLTVDPFSSEGDLLSTAIVREAVWLAFAGVYPCISLLKLVPLPTDSSVYLGGNPKQLDCHFLD